MKCAIILFALFALAYSTPYYGGRGGEVDIVSRGGGIAISYPTTGRRVVFTKTVTGGPNYIDVTVEGPNVPYKRYQIDTAQYIRGQDEALTGLLDQQIMEQIEEYRRSGDLDAAVSQAIRQLNYGLQQGQDEQIYQQGQPGRVQIGGIVVPVEQEREIELQSQIQQYPFNVYQRTGTQYRSPLQQLQQLAYLRQAVQQQQYGGPYAATLPRQMEYLLVLLQLQQEQNVLQQQIEQSTLRGQNDLAYVQYQQLQRLQEQEEQLREQIQQGSGLYSVWNMIRQPYGYYPEQQQYILNQLQQVQPQQNILGQLLQQQPGQQYVFNQLQQQPQYILNQLQQQQERVQQQQRIQQKENILSELQQGEQVQQQQVLGQLQQQNILNQLQQQPYGLRQFVQGLYNLGQVGRLGQQERYYQYQQQPRVGVVY